MQNPFKKFIPFFTEGQFWEKIKGQAKKAGIRTIYMALLLFYAYKRKDTPYWAKRIILGVLGYLIAPIDVLPDLSPFIGYTDDIGVLAFGVAALAAYINDEVRQKSKAQLHKWFGDFDENALEQPAA